MASQKSKNRSYFAIVFCDNLVRDEGEDFGKLDACTGHNIPLKNKGYTIDLKCNNKHKQEVQGLSVTVNDEHTKSRSTRKRKG